MTRDRSVPAPTRPGLTLLLGTLSAFGPLSIDLYLPALPSVQGEFLAGQSPVQLTLSAALTGAGLPVVLPGLFVVASATGVLMPNATALAMAGAARMAGTASALVGTGQFAIAALGAPLAGFGTPGTLLPMAVVMVGFAALASVAAACAARQPRAAHPPAVAADSRI